MKLNVSLDRRVKIAVAALLATAAIFAVLVGSFVGIFTLYSYVVEDKGLNGIFTVTTVMILGGIFGAIYEAIDKRTPY